MRSIIGFRTAANVLLVLFSAAFVFQLVVLAGFIPTEMVWGGRLANAEERTVGALVSLTFLMLMIVVLLLRTGRMPIMDSSRVGGRIGRYGMWVIVVLFALNTVGNIFAMDLRETLIFTPITLVSVLLAWRVALGE
jgi:hypothetical protein